MEKPRLPWGLSLKTSSDVREETARVVGAGLRDTRRGRSDRSGEQPGRPEVITNDYSPESGAARKSLRGAKLSADPFPTWGRPRSSGKKRVSAPDEQPG